MVEGGGICHNFKDGILSTPAGLENLDELYSFRLKNKPLLYLSSEGSPSVLLTRLPLWV